MSPVPGTSSPPAGRLNLLRIRDFRNVFLAQSISVFGDGITPVALTFAVLGLTGSATDLGLVLAAQSLPLAALALVGGVWADRWSRSNPRARLLVPVIGLSVAAPAILLASCTPVLTVALAALVCYGLARAFADANMMPTLCTIADPRYRATGYGVLNFFGCAVGGVTVYAGGLLRDAHVDISRVFQFAALTIAGCAVLLWFIRPTAPGK